MTFEKRTLLGLVCRYKMILILSSAISVKKEMLLNDDNLKDRVNISNYLDDEDKRGNSS